MLKSNFIYFHAMIMNDFMLRVFKNYKFIQKKLNDKIIVILNP